jgi:hypothetical protein
MASNKLYIKGKTHKQVDTLGILFGALSVSCICFFFSSSSCFHSLKLEVTTSYQSSSCSLLSPQTFHNFSSVLPDFWTFSCALASFQNDNNNNNNIDNINNNK